MYDGCFKIDFKFQKKLKIYNICMLDVLKLKLNLKKKIKNIQYMYAGCFKIMLNLKKIKNIQYMYTGCFKIMLKLKIFYKCMMDVLKFFF